MMVFREPRAGDVRMTGVSTAAAVGCPCSFLSVTVNATSPPTSNSGALSVMSSSTGTCVAGSPAGALHAYVPTMPMSVRANNRVFIQFSCDDHLNGTSRYLHLRLREV